MQNTNKTLLIIANNSSRNKIIFIKIQGKQYKLKMTFTHNFNDYDDYNKFITYLNNNTSNLMLIYIFLILYYEFI